MAVSELQLPLKDSDVAPLKLGDLIYLTGPAFTCRSRLQRYVFDGMDDTVAANMKEAYRMLGIPLDFEYTRLWATREYHKS